jgi:hypothetical protein
MNAYRDPQNEGRPLAVCINDCQIDCGQPRMELERLCFQLSCAFAELRWGDSSEARHTEATSASSMRSCNRMEPVIA